MSACSHGILAIAIELYKKGASTSSVVAFLLASPWANLPITFLLFGFFGLKAGLIIVSAIIIAFITGIIFQLLEKKGLVECDKCKIGEDNPVLIDFSIISDIKRRWKNYKFNSKNNIVAIKGTFRGSWALTKMVMWWLVIGMLMAAVARAYIPHHWFEQYMGPTILGLLVTLFFATIIEVCSEGSSPLAFEIYNRSIQAGAPAFGMSRTDRKPAWPGRSNLEPIGPPRRCAAPRHDRRTGQCSNRPVPSWWASLCWDRRASS